MVLIIHQLTNGKPAAFFSFSFYVREIRPIRTYNDPKKNAKATISCLKKRREKGGRLSVCLHMRFNYEVKIQIETRKIGRGIAVMPPVPITTCLI